MSSPEQILELIARQENNRGGYKSWGDVAVLMAIVRENNGISSASGKDGAELTEVQRQLAIKIFNKRKKINAILITQQLNGSKVAENIPPILDDQAQLLGPSLKYVGNSGNANKIFSALRGRYAVNLGDQTSICIGKSIEDAYIAAQLIEKTSKAFLGAKNLGGAKSINRFEAWAMHKFYMLKYSKESEKNR